MIKFQAINNTDGEQIIAHDTNLYSSMKDKYFIKDKDDILSILTTEKDHNHLL